MGSVLVVLGAGGGAVAGPPVRVEAAAMTDVSPNLRVTVDCACGECGLHGTPKRRPEGHVRNCPCRRCLGSRNRRSGDAQARKSRKKLGLVGAMSRHEEHWGGPVRLEAKSGAQVGPIWTRFQAARAQSEAARPIGDTRPFVMAAHPKGTSEFLLIVSSDDLAQFLDAYGGAL